MAIRDDWNNNYPPPPLPVRLSWLDKIQRLSLGYKITIELERDHRSLARNIIRWIMANDGARRSLPAGIVVHAWIKRPGVISLMRTQ